MKTRDLILIIVISFLCASCATKKLWENTDPNEYVRISASEITEEELKQRGIKYLKGYNNDFYVEKSTLLKFKDYTMRLFVTPITVVVDATIGTAFAVGVAVFSAKKLETQVNCDVDPDCRREGAYP